LYKAVLDNFENLIAMDYAFTPIMGKFKADGRDRDTYSDFRKAHELKLGMK
jgi:hypothetical protein